MCGEADTHSDIRELSEHDTHTETGNAYLFLSVRADACGRLGERTAPNDNDVQASVGHVEVNSQAYDGRWKNPRNDACSYHHPTLS
jgi:hypothetical protein